VLTRVLVAADTPILSEPTRLLLDARGHRLKICSHLAEAVGIVLDEPPDCLVVQKGFAGGRDTDLIATVKASLQKTNVPVILLVDSEHEANLDWQRYPVDDIMVVPASPEMVAARLALAEARMLRISDSNPLSHLPGNTSIIKAITRTIGADEAYGVGYVDIDNFKPYNDRYGFSQGDDVILMVARIIVNVIEERSRSASFVGHIGGDDFVFIVPFAEAEPVCQKILANFETVKTMFIDERDLAAGGFIGTDRLGRKTRFGLLSLSIAVVKTGKGSRFQHYGEVAAAASQVKHHVKQQEGSAYLIDRRSS